MLVGLLLLALAYSQRSPLGTWYVERKLEAATTAQEQAIALCRMNSWARSNHAASYALEAFDIHGEPMRPQHDGRYEDVATLVITWTNGSRATIRLLDSDGLGCAYHG
jgi:hypothetical protein